MEQKKLEKRALASEENMAGKPPQQLLREHLVSTEDSDTYTVKRVHKWTYSEDVKEPKSVLIQIKKITFRTTFKWDGGIIGYKERYMYVYEPAFVYYNTGSNNEVDQEIADEPMKKRKRLLSN